MSPFLPASHNRANPSRERRQNSQKHVMPDQQSH
ncbi:hypothetical protein mEp554_71 [Escherichia phage mEp554]